MQSIVVKTRSLFHAISKHVLNDSNKMYLVSHKVCFFRTNVVLSVWPNHILSAISFTRISYLLNMTVRQVLVPVAL